MAPAAQAALHKHKHWQRILMGSYQLLIGCDVVPMHHTMFSQQQCHYVSYSGHQTTLQFTN